MNFSSKTARLPYFTLGAGALGFVLRLWLMSTADSHGLLPPNHPANTLVWLLSGVFIIFLLFGCRSLLSANKYSFNFPAFLPGCIGTGLMAAGILICSLTELSAAADNISRAVAILGLLCVPVLGFLAHCRFKGAHPSYFFHALISIYLLLRLVSLYRQWSSDPQLQDYAFQLLATVFLMLASYHRITFDANIGSRRHYTFFALGAVFFCITALPHCDSAAFFIAGAAWMFTNLCSLLPMPRTQQSSQDTTQEEA